MNQDTELNVRNEEGECQLMGMCTCSAVPVPLSTLFSSFNWRCFAQKAFSRTYNCPRIYALRFHRTVCYLYSVEFDDDYLQGLVDSGSSEKPVVIYKSFGYDIVSPANRRAVLLRLLWIKDNICG